MLQIKNLHAEVAGKPILKGLSLTVTAGAPPLHPGFLFFAGPKKRNQK